MPASTKTPPALAQAFGELKRFDWTSATDPKLIALCHVVKEAFRKAGKLAALRRKGVPQIESWKRHPETNELYLPGNHELGTIRSPADRATCGGCGGECVRVPICDVCDGWLWECPRCRGGRFSDGAQLCVCTDCVITLFLKAQQHPKDLAYGVAPSNSWRFQTLGKSPHGEYEAHVCAEFTRSIREMGIVVERLWLTLPVDTPKPHPDGLDEKTKTLWKDNKETPIDERLRPFVEAAFSGTALKIGQLRGARGKPISRRTVRCYVSLASTLLLDLGFSTEMQVRGDRVLVNQPVAITA